MNSVIDLLNTHTSIRKFNQIPITDNDVAKIIGAAKQGATAGNMMMYSIIKIRSKEILAKLAITCDKQSFIETADIALLFVVDNAKWHHYFKLRGIEKEFSNYKGPTISDLTLGIQDAMIAAQNAVVAAESLGIGTCYIGDILEHNEVHRSLFNLPDYVMPATLIVMGHYDAKPAVRARFKDDFTVFDERYPDLSDSFIDEMFSASEQNNPDFAKKFYSRKMDADFFKEMNRSIELYYKQWNHSHN